MQDYLCNQKGVRIIKSSEECIIPSIETTCQNCYTKHKPEFGNINDSNKKITNTHEQIIKNGHGIN